MSRGLTLVALAFAIFLKEASFSATAVRSKDSEGRRISEEEAVRIAVFTPSPHYPYEARANHLTGTGTVRLEVDAQTGYVTSARMLKSTGHQVLDDEALKAYRHWRFKPRTVSAVRIPVTFSLSFPEYVSAKGHSLWLQNATYWFLPKYPPEAREKSLTGKGVAILKVDPASGYVVSAWMLKSTGHQILDSGAILAFRQWRFRPRSITRLEVPIQFTPNGVFY